MKRTILGFYNAASSTPSRSDLSDCECPDTMPIRLTFFSGSRSHATRQYSYTPCIHFAMSGTSMEEGASFTSGVGGNGKVERSTRQNEISGVRRGHGWVLQTTFSSAKEKTYNGTLAKAANWRG